MSDTLAPALAGTPPEIPAPPPGPPAGRHFAPADEPRQRPRLAHTRGGLPVIPLAVATGNTTVAAVSAATLAGGPLALALLAGGAATGAGVAALRARSRRSAAAKRAGSANTTPSGRTGPTSRAAGGGGSRSPIAGAGSGGRGPAGRHQRGPSTGSARPAGSAAGAGSRSAAHRTPAAPAAAGRGSRQKSPGGTGGPGRAGGPAGARVPSPRSTGSTRPPGASGSGAGVRAAQVRAARAERSAAAPTLRERRHQDAAARRTVGETRRTAKQAARDGRRAAKTQARETAAADRAGRSGRKGATAGAPAARSVKEAAREAKRQARADRRAAKHAARDGRADQRVRERRVAMRKGAAARTARRRLRRSAWRYWARWTGAALLAGAVGLLGTVTTPIGRRLGMPWLMYPGRRLFARLLDRARAERAARDQAIAAALDADLEAAEVLDRVDAPSGAVQDTVPRAPRNHNAADSTAPSSLGGSMTATFSFAAVAAEMEALAHTFEPDGMMAVLQMCEELPEALQSIANVFKILAEKADTEFPLEPAVGEAFNEVYITIQMASVAGGEVGPVFRDVHEQDIRRHEDPRNGEDKWDTTNN